MILFETGFLLLDSSTLDLPRLFFEVDATVRLSRLDLCLGMNVLLGVERYVGIWKKDGPGQW